MRITTFVLALALALPTSAAFGQQAQQTQDEAALATLRAAMTPAAYTSFTAELRAARDQGLPTQPLVAKALEGAAKNVPGERILAAVRQTTQELNRARTLLQPAGGVTAAEISAVATAMQRGVPADAVSRLAADAGGRGGVGLSAHVLADIMAHGVPVSVGVEVLGAWRSHGADPNRLNEIPGAVERLVRQGVVPARAAAAIGAGLRAGRTPGSIGPVDVPRLIGGG
ncbi:MAG TPA: hypothetical protein VK929_09145 [Longimicrobiales bacterium]|nr:hypothetical protein [Longimicrobiales bacterium]